MGWVTFAVGWLVFTAAQSPELPAAERIVLRELQVIHNRSITRFDLDGVRLDDGALLTWDRIERASLRDESRQSSFDEHLTKIGTPLYRIRQRMSVGDYASALSKAESLRGHYERRQSRTALMVLQALMWGHLDHGERELAVAPYLRSLAILQRLDEEPAVAGPRQLRFDAATGLSDQLVPIWFDSPRAAEALPDLERAVDEWPRPAPAAAYIYLATMASAAEQPARARQVLDTWRPADLQQQALRAVVLGAIEMRGGSPQLAQQHLDAAVVQLDPAYQPLALYWQARAKLAAAESLAEEQQAVLGLLHLPAVHGERFPELAAAALYESIGPVAGWNREGSQAVRRELLVRYGPTYHGRLLRESEKTPPTPVGGSRPADSLNSTAPANPQPAQDAPDSRRRG